MSDHITITLDDHAIATAARFIGIPAHRAHALLHLLATLQQAKDEMTTPRPGEAAPAPTPTED